MAYFSDQAKKAMKGYNYVFGAGIKPARPAQPMIKLPGVGARRHTDSDVPKAPKMPKMPKREM